MTERECQKFLALLAEFQEESLFTPDEAIAAGILREAVEAIMRGEDLVPPAAGEPVKIRLLRRISVQYFHHLAPRPQLTPDANS